MLPGENVVMDNSEEDMTVVTQALRWVRGQVIESGVGKFIALTEPDKRVSVYAGNVEYHAHISTIAGIPHEDVRARLFAAGTFSQEGEVLSWESKGYEFETPTSRRPEMERFFSGQRKAIKECWGR